MTRRFAIAALALVVVALATTWWWWGTGRSDRSLRPASPASPPGTAAERSPSPESPRATARPAQLPPALPTANAAGEVAISGRVIDIQQPKRAVAGVEVVFRSDAGDASTVTERDGGYAIRVPAGTYQAFVRDDAVLSIGRREPTRLPWSPLPETARVPDEALMSVVRATRDTTGIDLSVVQSGIVVGRVVDHRGRSIAGAVVHAIGAAIRPVIATDIAVSSSDGSFELRLPPGVVELAASHPRFAGTAADPRMRYTVKPGERLQTTLMLRAGCVITGRVVERGGARAGDGAIER